MRNVIDALQERGFIEATTSEDLRAFAEKPLKVYCGFDPTADSLHLGNLVAIMGLAWFQKFGHTPVALVGGATGMIGDPSGKSVERQLLDEKTLEKNLQGLKKNLTDILKPENGAGAPLILNNFDWFKEFSFIDFLRDVGKYFRMGPMLSKESVRARLNSEEGMSFTEFSYQLLQGYDFLYLHQKHAVSVQLGGSDQWGNITAGIELIRKKEGACSVYGVTFPLLTKSDGQKFGKSEKGAVWLSPEKLSPYEFYQYLIRVADEDVISLMRMLTFLEMSEIMEYERAMKREDYTPNAAQKRLAQEVTRLVHGEEGVRLALNVTSSAAPGAETALSEEVLENLSRNLSCCVMRKSQATGLKIVDAMVITGLCLSKGEARKLIKNGGVYLNNERVKEESYAIEEERFIAGKYLLLAVGKKNKTVIRLEG